MCLGNKNNKTLKKKSLYEIYLFKMVSSQLLALDIVE
jgi:hypothetical protein